MVDLFVGGGSIVVVLGLGWQRRQVLWTEVGLGYRVLERHKSWSYGTVLGLGFDWQAGSGMVVLWVFGSRSWDFSRCVSFVLVFFFFLMAVIDCVWVVGYFGVCW
jgi:hypothetical protein